LNQRKEKGGLHLFNRKSGTHILLDELNFSENEISKSPRTISIAVTNVCNLNCPFCYAPKNHNSLPLDFLKNAVKEFDKLKVFEITIGGGEPFAYPNLVEFCKWTWENTKLGINITTNGQLLNENIISDLEGYISSIRISIEAIGAKYSKVRGASFSKIQASINSLKGKIPMSINCVVLKNNVDNLIEVIEFAMKNSIYDVLIIAEHNKGLSVLDEKELHKIENIILEYKDKIQLTLTDELAKLLDINILSDGDTEEYGFAHLSSDKKIKQNSFAIDGIKINDISDIKDAFIKLYKNKEVV